jgi:integrase
MRIFQEFLLSQGKGTYKPDGIYLGEISLPLIEDYIAYRRDVKKNQDSTINHSLTPIISAVTRANDEGLIDARIYADIKDCRVVEQPRLDSEQFDGKSFLTKEQLQKLVEFYNQDSEPRRKEYIEIFLFAFHSGGLRMVDVMTLMWSHINIEKKELRKIQVKTATGKHQRHTVPLNDAAIAILYRWKQRARREKFVFDLVDDTFNIDDSENLYYTRNSCDRKVNQSLHVVGNRIGLDANLTFHWARHTFAILSLNDGMSLSMVSRFLGHSSTDVTEQVYADYLPTTLAEELDKLNYYYVPDFDGDN